MKNKKHNSIFNRFAGKGVFPPQLAFTLLLPARNLILSPEKLIKKIKHTKRFPCS